MRDNFPIIDAEKADLKIHVDIDKQRHRLLEQIVDDLEIEDDRLDQLISDKVQNIDNIFKEQMKEISNSVDTRLKSMETKIDGINDTIGNSKSTLAVAIITSAGFGVASVLGLIATILLKF